MALCCNVAIATPRSPYTRDSTQIDSKLEGTRIASIVFAALEVAFGVCCFGSMAADAC
jgi:hypothetical protein